MSVIPVLHTSAVSVNSPSDTWMSNVITACPALLMRLPIFSLSMAVPLGTYTIPCGSQYQDKFTPLSNHAWHQLTVEVFISNQSFVTDGFTILYVKTVESGSITIISVMTLMSTGVTTEPIASLTPAS